MVQIDEIGCKVAYSGNTASKLESLSALSSGRDRQKVLKVRSGPMTRSTNVPSAQPLSNVSKIDLLLSILGRLGRWANAPTKSFTRLAHDKIKGVDALHLACAEVALADCLVTCDDRMIKRYSGTVAIKTLTELAVRIIS